MSRNFKPLSQLFLVPVLVSVVLGGCNSSERATHDDQSAVQSKTEIVETIRFDTLSIRIPGSDVAFRMIPLQGGEFTLGYSDVDESSADDEKPVVRVRISPFFMAATEVTYEAFAIFRFKDRDSDSTNVAGKTLPVDAVARPSTPYEDPSFGMGGSGYPAVGMTQWSALQYARWMSDKTGTFFRLPTEAEWEYACLSGAADGSPLGISETEIEEHVWFAGNSENRIQLVAAKRPSSAGLFDMNGNVAEWTLDQYDEFFYRSLSEGNRPIVDPWRMPEKLHPRTVRGGYYSSDLEELRCARRVESNMRWKRRDPQIPKSLSWNTDSPFVGFRLVAPLHPPSTEEQSVFWSLVLGE